jgi:hypothetical protein
MGLGFRVKGSYVLRGSVHHVSLTLSILWIFPFDLSIRSMPCFRCIHRSSCKGGNEGSVYSVTVRCSTRSKPCVQQDSWHVTVPYNRQLACHRAVQQDSWHITAPYNRTAGMSPRRTTGQLACHRTVQQDSWHVTAPYNRTAGISPRRTTGQLACHRTGGI